MKLIKIVLIFILLLTSIVYADAEIPHDIKNRENILKIYISSTLRSIETNNNQNLSEKYIKIESLYNLYVNTIESYLKSDDYNKLSPAEKSIIKYQLNESLTAYKETISSLKQTSQSVSTSYYFSSAYEHDSESAGSNTSHISGEAKMEVSSDSNKMTISDRYRTSSSHNRGDSEHNIDLEINNQIDKNTDTEYSFGYKPYRSATDKNSSYDNINAGLKFLYTTNNSSISFSNNYSKYNYINNTDKNYFYNNFIFGYNTNIKKDRLALSFDNYTTDNSVKYGLNSTYSTQVKKWLISYSNKFDIKNYNINNESNFIKDRLAIQASHYNGFNINSGYSIDTKPNKNSLNEKIFDINCSWNPKEKNRFYYTFSTSYINSNIQSNSGYTRFLINTPLNWKLSSKQLLTVSPMLNRTDYTILSNSYEEDSIQAIWTNNPESDQRYVLMSKYLHHYKFYSNQNNYKKIIYNFSYNKIISSSMGANINVSNETYSPENPTSSDSNYNAFGITSECTLKTDNYNNLLLSFNYRNRYSAKNSSGDNISFITNIKWSYSY